MNKLKTCQLEKLVWQISWKSNYKLKKKEKKSQLKGGVPIQALFPTKVSNLLQEQQLRSGYCWKFHFSKIFKRNCSPYLRLNTKRNMLKHPKSNGTQIQPKPSALQNIFTKMLNTKRNSLVWGSKLMNSNTGKQIFIHIYILIFFLT